MNWRCKPNLIRVICAFLLTIIIVGLQMLIASGDMTAEQLVIAQENISTIAGYVPTALTFAIAALQAYDSRAKQCCWAMIVSFLAMIACFAACCSMEGMAFWNSYGTIIGLFCVLASNCIEPLGKETRR